MKEDEENERKLGTRYLAEIDDKEAGSLLESVTRRLQADTMM